MGYVPVAPEQVGTTTPPPIIIQHFDPSDKINISGVALTVGIGLLALLIAYLTYRLQRHFHRQRQQSEPYELEAAPLNPAEGFDGLPSSQLSNLLSPTRMEAPPNTPWTAI
jgi:hypothetical protein